MKKRRPPISEWGPVTKADTDCYRKNYGPGWHKYQNGQGWVMLPVGILDAIKILCDEVDRLR